MFMEKNVRLINIYIKIHNKKNLTMDDLAFLAKYDRECFEKTCKNVLYNMPETKPVMQASAQTPKAPAAAQELPAVLKKKPYDMRDQVETVLARLKKLEANPDVLMVQNVNAEKVKNLIGNLYMEMLFPHNDVDQYFDMQDVSTPTFNAKA